MSPCGNILLIATMPKRYLTGWFETELGS
jgi:hypothetical protein